MKKLLMKSLAVLMIVGAFALVSFAQSNSKIIKFPNGKNSVVEKFTLNAEDGIAYMVKLKQFNLVKFQVGGLYTNGSEAQGLEIKLRKSDNWDDTLAEASPGEEVEYQAQKGDGDYEIVVMNPGNRKANITLNLCVNCESADSDAGGEMAQLTSGSGTAAQTPKRIDFAKEGSNSLVWEEKVAANSTKSFVFAAKKGQKLSLGMVDDTKQGSMDLGKISIEPNTDENFEMEIEVTKDYTFYVSNNSNKSTSFRIFITLENATGSAKSSPSGSSNPNAVRVQFAKGETSAMITKDISGNGSVDFLINVRKGQKLEYTVGYDFKDSDIEAFLTEPGLQDISHSSGPKDRQEFKVQKTGDHRLTVNNTTKKKVTITLYLDVE